MPRWVNTGEDILPVPESKLQLPGLPEQASATATAMRFFGLRKRAAEEIEQGRPAKPEKPERLLPEQAHGGGMEAVPQWVDTGVDIVPLPEQYYIHTPPTIPPLPEQASARAIAARAAALARRPLSGLGVIDTDLCLWAESLTPEQQNALYLVPAMPTIKMKTAVYPQPYGAMAPDTGQGLGLVCGVNRWVAEHPWLAGAAILAGALLLGGTGKRTGTRVRRRVPAAPRRAA